MSAPLKLLDVGCHDGFVGRWLQERFDGELVIDGVELHPGFAEKARERGYRRVEVASAVDVPQLWAGETFDAISCFEVLEHVPDMDELLGALEQVLAPDGRLLVSTPDGTFGAGENPHHLRALRAIDLADLLRRRGHLHDMIVGPDGVSVASYTPGPRRGDVAIFTGPSWMRWSPMDIVTKGLGGSETAAVRLAEHLSCLGFVVTVYGEVDPCCYRDVLFADWRTFDPMVPRVAVIASRMPEVFDRPVAARTRLLWMHDTDAGPRLTQQRADKIDHVLTLSGWHERHVKGLYPFLNGKVTQTRNGIEQALFRDTPGDTAGDTTRAKRVLYTSSPDRGLDLILELWPEVRKRVPDAELCFTYAPVYYDIAEQDPVVGEHAALIRKLQVQDGVVALGSRSQPDLARLMLDSSVWVCPSWNTPHAIPFHETSCIGAMEAQAAGLHVVASNWGALPETVRVGALIDGDTTDGDDGRPKLSDKWRRAFVNEIVRGLTDPKTQRNAQAAGPEAVRKMGWDGVAQQVEALIDPR